MHEQWPPIRALNILPDALKDVRPPREEPSPVLPEPAVGGDLPLDTFTGFESFDLVRDDTEQVLIDVVAEAVEVTGRQ